jgi:ADP-ribosylation factor-like protein 2
MTTTASDTQPTITFLLL